MRSLSEEHGLLFRKILQRPNEAFYYRDLAVSYNNIGWIFESKGNLDMAQKEYMEAYEPAKRAAEIDPDSWKELFDDIRSKIKSFGEMT